MSSQSQAAHLTFSKISRADAGMYTCRANNSVGIAEKKVYVAVNCKCYVLSLGTLIPHRLK